MEPGRAGTDEDHPLQIGATQVRGVVECLGRHHLRTPPRAGRRPRSRARDPARPTTRPSVVECDRRDDDGGERSDDQEHLDLDLRTARARATRTRRAPSPCRAHEQHEAGTGARRDDVRAPTSADDGTQPAPSSMLRPRIAMRAQANSGSWSQEAHEEPGQQLSTRPARAPRPAARSTLRVPRQAGPAPLEAVARWRACTTTSRRPHGELHGRADVARTAGVHRESSHFVALYDDDSVAGVRVGVAAPRQAPGVRPQGPLRRWRSKARPRRRSTRARGATAVAPDGRSTSCSRAAASSNGPAATVSMSLSPSAQRHTVAPATAVAASATDADSLTSTAAPSRNPLLSMAPAPPESNEPTFGRRSRRKLVRHVRQEDPG